MTVVVKEGNVLREGCGMCTCRKGIEWLLSCVVGVCGVAFGRAWRAEANEEKKVPDWNGASGE